jgi:phosphoglycerol transferase
MMWQVRVTPTPVLLLHTLYCGVVFVALYVYFSMGADFSVNSFFTYPLSYSGDTLFHWWVITMIGDLVAHGSTRFNYPFSFDFFDFSGIEYGQFLFHALSLSLTNNPIVVQHLFFFLSFILVFLSTSLSTYFISGNFAHSLLVALLYAFVPFHFMRIAHFSYTMYVLPPLVIAVGYSLYSPSTGRHFARPTTRRALVFTTLAFLFLSFFLSIIYYVLFGLLFLSVFLLFSAHRRLTRSNVVLYLSVAGPMILTVLLQITPTLIYQYIHGPNPLVAYRGRTETEYYSLRLYNVILPRADHVISALRLPIQKLDPGDATEQATATAGIAGGLGFLFILVYLARLFANRSVPLTSRYFIFVVVLSIVFATPGSLNSLIALINPSIRAWNRISIYLCYPLYYVFVETMGYLLARLPVHRHISFPLQWSLLTLFIFEMNVPPAQSARMTSATAYRADHAYYTEMESRVPPRTAIVQLPHMSFPEAPGRHRLDSYSLAKAMIHTEHLRWSWGGTRGRQGDTFYRSLDRYPIADQLTIASTHGFSGVDVALQGYPNDGADIISALASHFGRPPDLVHPSGSHVFYHLPAPSSVPHETFFEPFEPLFIDLTKRGTVDGICQLRGFSGWEPAGRWTDSHISPTAEIEFCRALPTSFTLTMKARTTAPTLASPIGFQVGTTSFASFVSPEYVSLSQDIRNPMGEKILHIRPPFTVAPSDLGSSRDSRALGIQLQYIYIESKQ